MGTLTVTITAENAAFDDRGMELARCLRVVAKKIESGTEDGVVMDSNGNKVGEFAIEQA